MRRKKIIHVDPRFCGSDAEHTIVLANGLKLEDVARKAGITEPELIEILRYKKRTNKKIRAVINEALDWYFLGKGRPYV